MLKDSIEIMGRYGIKYTDEKGIEYFLDSEMIVSDLYDFALFSDCILLFKDYLKRSSSDNISFYETYNPDKKCYVGEVKYKKDFDSNISKEKKEKIINRVIKLGNEKNMRIEVFNNDE